MPGWLLPRSAASAELLVGVGAEYGLTLRQCLRDTGIDPATLAEPDSEVASWQELRLIRNLVKGISSTGPLGVEAGLRYRITMYGPLALAMLSSPTLRAAAELAITYRQLLYGFCRPVPDPTDRAAVILDPTRLPADLAGFLVERDIAVAVSITRDLWLTRSPVRKIELTADWPANGMAYRRLLGCSVRFGCAANRVVFDAELVDAPLPLADLRARALALADCRALLRRRQSCGRFADQVRGLLLAGAETVPTLERVAAELATSGRTLRRRLAAEGTSYRELLGEVRITLAQEWLADGTLSVEQIACRLGYSESSAFSHAFTYRTGMSPRTYRDSLR